MLAECTSSKLYITKFPRSWSAVGDLLRQTTPADTDGLFGDAKSLCPYGTVDLLGEEAARVLGQPEKAAVEAKVTISRSQVQLCGLVAESCTKWEVSTEDINRW